jgi:hypothetical protein
MCCFSQPVISVNATNIFARPDDGGRQFLAYSMTFRAKKELAMVLPLPVRLGTDEKDVSFIDLSGYPDFFVDSLNGFPEPVKQRWSLGDTKSADIPTVSALDVVHVGNFEASFVPTMKDFSRLDERFRISDKAWKQLPAYKDFGFAVFKLKAGSLKVHPMAFSFPRRDLKTLFFPTVHIHDGKVHSKAKFDHNLYCQQSEHEQVTVRDWRESAGNAGKFMKADESKGLILANHHCYQKKMRGKLPNQDTYVKVTA